MNLKKLLPLLAALLVLINYENYFKGDQKKLAQKAVMLTQRIHHERYIKEVYSNKTLLQELQKSSPYSELMFDGRTQSYSQAMGAFQNLITEADKENCKVSSLKWSQSEKSELWYDKLRMNFRAECSPKDFITYTNRLRNSHKLITIESFSALKKGNANLSRIDRARIRLGLKALSKEDTISKIIFNITYLAFREKKYDENR